MIGLTVLAIIAGVVLAVMFAPKGGGDGALDAGEIMTPAEGAARARAPEPSGPGTESVDGTREDATISSSSGMAAMLERAEAGEADAQFSVGVAYLDGVGIEQNRETGLDWLRQASANGNKTAGYILAELGETAQQ